MTTIRMQRLAAAVAAAAALAAVAGCGGKQQAGGFAPPPTPVETAVVAPGAVADRFATVGTLEADLQVEIAAEIDGVVRTLPLPEGGAVRAGALLATLDDVQLAAEAQRAEALRDQGRATWERVRTVVEQGAGAPQDLDDATAALKVAEANLDLARARLGKTRITAPFAGSVGLRRVSPGAFVRAGTALTDLSRLDRLRLTFSVPERLLGRLKAGDPVRIETTAHPGEVIEGAVTVIEPQLDGQTRATRVVATVANPDLRLRPGMSATVTLVLDERAEALTVPDEAVFVTGGQAFVFVVKPDSTVARAAVQLGTRLPGVVEVTGGLDRGQVVVKAGHQKLYDGARVMPTGGAPGGAGDAAAAGGGAR